MTDHLNTVRDLVSYNPGTDTTTPEGHITYDAFGNVTNTPAVDILFGFTGRLFDEDTGLQNNLNRWYDAEVGRWLSEDPIGFEGEDANLYRYCGNGSTNATDPSGNLWAPGLEHPKPTPVPRPKPTPRKNSTSKKNRDYTDCLSSCVKQHTITNAGTGAFHCSNAAGNAFGGRYPRAGIGRPSGSPSSWQHRATMGTKYSKIGKLAGRASIVFTVAEGFHDIGVEIACALICGDLYPGVDKDDWVK